MLIRQTLIALVVIFSTSALAKAECCDHCGCDSGCRKVCHLKCDVKKVTKVEYSCECEDFCVPCKSEKVGTKCECTCKECLLGCKEHCCEKPVYKPTGATIHTRKKLIKHEVTKEVPTYKWVVESVCDGCVHRCRTCQEGQSRAEVEAAARSELAGDHRPSAPPVPEPETEAPSESWWNAMVKKTLVERQN